MGCMRVLAGAWEYGRTEGPIAEVDGGDSIQLRKKKGEIWRTDWGRRFCWRTSPLTTACDQKSAWPVHHRFIKLILSFACGSLGIMLATATTNTLTSTFRWSFSFFDTRIEFRSMFIATLFLFLFLCLGQYSYFASNTISPFLFRLRRPAMSQGGLA